MKIAIYLKKGDEISVFNEKTRLGQIIVGTEDSVKIKTDVLISSK